jgi:hypothetical protein
MGKKMKTNSIKQKSQDEELVSQLIIRNRLGEADTYLRANKAKRKGLRIAYKQAFDI